MKRWITELAMALEAEPPACRCRGRRRTGSAIVEFAAGSGLMLAALACTFDLGYTFVCYNKLEMAVNQGARFASMVPYDSSTTTPSATFLSAVQNMVLYGSPTAGSTKVLSGLTAGNIRLVVTFANGVPRLVEVSVTGYTISALFGHHALTGKPRVSFPYQGVWAPA